MILAHVWFCLQFLVCLLKEQCESKLHQTKKKSAFYLVRTKASELADFPGLNTPLMTTESQDLGLMSHLKDGAFLTV